ncbi:hypothetical protein ES703_68832 [subsurface metagenome]
MDALKLVLGETYPTARAITQRDFRNHDTSLEINIKIQFNEGISTYAGDCYGFCLKIKNDDLDYYTLQQNRLPLTYKGKPVRISNEMREQIPLIFVDIDRSAQNQLRPTKWTLYGRILGTLNRKFQGTTGADEFSSKIEEAREILKKEIIKDFERNLEDGLSNLTDIPVGLEFSIADPLDHLKTLRPYFIENELRFDAEQVGMGLQSALLVSLTRVYKEIVKESGIIAIEEPGLYLHPHARHHFYNVLKEMTDSGTQVFYSTHDSEFLDLVSPQFIYLVKKENGTTQVYTFDESLSQIEAAKLVTKIAPKVTEIFFSKLVILVEGEIDRIAVSSLLEKNDIDINRFSISVLPCGSKNEIPFVGTILRKFNVPTITLFDEDPGKPSETRNEEIKITIGKDNVYIMCPNFEEIFGFKSKLSQIEAIKHFDEISLSNYPDIFNRLLESVQNFVRENSKEGTMEQENELPF